MKRKMYRTFWNCKSPNQKFSGNPFPWLCEILKFCPFSGTNFKANKFWAKNLFISHCSWFYIFITFLKFRIRCEYFGSRMYLRISCSDSDSDSNSNFEFVGKNQFCAAEAFQQLWQWTKVKERKFVTHKNQMFFFYSSSFCVASLWHPSIFVFLYQNVIDCEKINQNGRNGTACPPNITTQHIIPLINDKSIGFLTFDIENVISLLSITSSTHIQVHVEFLMKNSSDSNSHSLLTSHCVAH